MRAAPRVHRAECVEFSLAVTGVPHAPRGEEERGRHRHDEDQGLPSAAPRPGDTRCRCSSLRQATARRRTGCSRLRGRSAPIGKQYPNHALTRAVVRAHADRDDKNLRPTVHGLRRTFAVSHCQRQMLTSCASRRRWARSAPRLRWTGMSICPRRVWHR